MADFLTTKAIASKLEDIIIKAQKTLYIITPYLKISNSFYERLSEATEKKIRSYIVYGKNELTKREETLINDLNCDIYFKENLHGKCYANESTALISSMNLHSFSEENNREFGILITKQNDSLAYEDCINEIESVILKAKPIRIIHDSYSIPNLNSDLNQTLKVSGNDEGGDDFDYSKFILEWNEYLINRFSKLNFNIIYGKISSENFPIAGIDFSTNYGFITLKFNDKMEKLNTLKEKELPHLREVFKNYRLYWSNATQISIYHAKDIRFSNLTENIKYCAEGLDKISAELKRMYIA